MQHELNNDYGIVNTINYLNNFEFVYENNDDIDIINIATLQCIHLIKIPQYYTVLDGENATTNYNLSDNF